MLNRRTPRFEPLEDRRLLAVLTVDTLDDTVDLSDGRTSLREAIFAANLVGGPDEIKFAAALTSSGSASILLAQGALQISGDLTITGPGAGLLTIDANASDPTPAEYNGDGSSIFIVDDGQDGPLLNVAIGGLTLTGGDSQYGGAILSTEKLTLTSSVIFGNSAMELGGGIAGVGGQLVVDNCTIADNITAGFGGGISSFDAELTVRNSRVSGNIGNEGGGIHSSESSLTVLGSHLFDNQAAGLAATGGGIHQGIGSLTVRDSRIAGNSADAGGGLYSSHNASITRSTITGNLAERSGGGIYAFRELEISETTVSNNTASVQGAGIRAQGEVAIRSSTIARNTAGRLGGGIWLRMEDATAEIINSTVSGNLAGDQGGGVWMSAVRGTTEIKHSTVAENKTSQVNSVGGGIFVFDGALRLDHTIVATNESPSGSDLAGFLGASIEARYSLIGRNDNSGLAESPLNRADANGNRIGGPQNGVIDPQLGPLANYGGRTQTHALAARGSFNRSPALDVGDPAARAGIDGVPAFDQRGMPNVRVADSYGHNINRIDTGAFEAQGREASVPPDGDYNRNRIVDAADYLVWRATLGNIVDPGSGADGNGDGLINDADIDVWRKNFGRSSTFVTILLPQLPTSGGTSAPETDFPDVRPQEGGSGGGSESAIIVDTLSDVIDFGDGFTSLREAIFAANLVDGLQTIEFATALTANGPATISLTHGQLRISDDLTISGPGAGRLTIDASGSDPTPAENNGDGSRIFHVEDGGVGTLVNVRISGLTLSGGDARGNGGAILSRENLTIVGSTLTGNAATPDENAYLSYGGAIAQIGGSLTVTGSVISNNAGGFGGGIHFDGTTLFVSGSVIADNVGSSGVGIYHRSGDGLIQATLIRGNMAGAFSLGGGVYTSGNLRVESTTISGNAAAFGGGLFSRTETVGDNETLIVNSTISGNTAFERGGGVRNALGRTIIEHSTVTANQAPPTEGGGVATRGYATSRTEVSHTIIAGNAASDVDFGTGTINTFLSRGYNVIGSGNGVGAFGAAGDKVGVTNPQLGPLADNGGPTLPDGGKLLTHALLAGSPTINAGDLNAKASVGGVPLYDQRGEPFSRVVNGRIDIGAFEYQAPSDLNLLVDTLVDESDGDFTRGDLSLREAIELANQYPSDDTIRFDPALTAAGPATILLAMGELRITDDVSIKGRGAEMLTIDASGNDPTPGSGDGRRVGDGSRVFNVNDGSAARIEVSVSGLRVTGGDVSGSGGGISSAESLVLKAVTVEHNAASSGIADGGGVQSTGPLLIEDSRIANNIAAGRASHGGIAAFAGITVRDSEISQNRGGTGGLNVRGGDVEITNTAIVNNIGTGLEIQTGNRTARISGSTILENVGEGRGGIVLTVANGGTAVLSDSVIRGNKANAQFGAGGGAYVVALTGGQARIDGVLFVDNAAASAGGLYAVGNVRINDSEFHGNAATGFQGLGGGIHLATSTALVSSVEIRGSIIQNNSSSSPNLNGGHGGGIYSRAPINLIDSIVSGNSATGSGGGIYSAAPNSSIVRSTVRGNAATLDGGGVFSPASSRQVGLHVSQSTISENTAGRDGGGLFANADPVVVSSSTIHGNSARNGGGFAICQESIVDESTLSGNLASALGGGIWSTSATLVRSTVTANGAEIAGGGAFSAAGPLTLRNTIVAGNFAPLGRDLTGLLGAEIAAHYSLIGSNHASGLAPAPVGSPDSNGNLIGSVIPNDIDARLGPLADNGGPTMTHALSPGSPAIDAGDPAAMAGVGDVPLYDQRGAPFTRVYGGRIDIGAFEWQPIAVGGDYNGNGAVDAADFALWRKTLGSAADLRADGNRDGVVDDADRIVWRTNFGHEATEGQQEVNGAPSVQGDLVIQEDTLAEPVAPVVAARRSAWRPTRATVELNEDLLISLVSPRAIQVEREEFAPRKRAGFEDEVDEAIARGIRAIDDAFAVLGSD